MDRNHLTDEQLDALIREAYGEAEPGDVDLLRGVESPRESAIYRNMKMELKGLGDIPECQLNSARLKDALLSREVRPATAWPWASVWKTALPLAACFGFGLFVMNNRAGMSSPDGLLSEPTVTAPIEKPVDESAGRVAEASPSTETKPIVMNGAVKSSPVPVLKTPVAKSTFSPRVRRKSAGRRLESKAETSPGVIASAAAIADPTNKGSGKPLSLDGQPGSMDVPGGLEKGVPGPVGSGGGMAASDPKVVIVSAEADPLTRAQPAVEVDKKNVVFGG